MKASICVVTYKQEKYIRECLESLVNQETDFGYEILIGVDASNDRTKEIVEQFAFENPLKVKLIIHDSNVGACANYRSVHSLAVGNYIAHCDGDDFWHQGKLQYQVDFLEKNPCVVQCWHCATLVDDNSNSIGIFPSRFARCIYKKKLNMCDIALSYALVGQHSTHIYRREYRPNLEEEGEFLDYLVALKLSKFGISYYSKKILSSYRVPSTDTATRNHAARKLAVDYLAIHAIKEKNEESTLAPYLKANIITRMFFSYIRGHDINRCLEAYFVFSNEKTRISLVLKSLFYFLAQKIRL